MREAIPSCSKISGARMQRPKCGTGRAGTCWAGPAHQTHRTLELLPTSWALPKQARRWSALRAAGHAGRALPCHSTVQNTRGDGGRAEARPAAQSRCSRSGFVFPAGRRPQHASRRGNFHPARRRLCARAARPTHALTRTPPPPAPPCLSGLQAAEPPSLRHRPGRAVRKRGNQGGAV